MDEATIKAMKLRNETGKIVRRTRVYKDISVEGFESCSLEKYAVELALRKHFAPCGKIATVFVFKSLAFIRFEGEGVQEKALELDGTDLGGWTAIVKPTVRPIEINLPSYPIIKTNFVFVKGYDTRLAEIDNKIALRNHFSSCGEVTRVGLVPVCAGFGAVINIGGEGCVEKALELNGSDMGGMNLVVYSGKRTTEIRKSRRLIDENNCGYLHGTISSELVKKKKMELEMEMEKGKKEKMMVKIGKDDDG